MKKQQNFICRTTQPGQYQFFLYSKKSLLKSSYPKKHLPNFRTSKNSGIKNFKPKEILRSSPSLEIPSTPLGPFLWRLVWTIGLTLERKLRFKLLRDLQGFLLYSWRFSHYSVPFHWLVHGHMTSNNETVSRQMP